MSRDRWIPAAVFAVVGTAQALDSGVRLAPAAVIALVAVAVLVPLAAFLLTARRAIHGAAAVVCGILTLAARLLSPVPLPELTLVAWIAGVLVLFGALSDARRQAPAVQ
jgi:hypothetical protein